MCDSRECAMAVPAMPEHGRDARGTSLRRAMAILAMPEHRQECLSPISVPTSGSYLINLNMKRRKISGSRRDPR